MKGNPHRAIFVNLAGGHSADGRHQETRVRVILKPDTADDLAAYFAALEAAAGRDFQPLVDIRRDCLAHAETPKA